MVRSFLILVLFAVLSTAVSSAESDGSGKVILKRLGAKMEKGVTAEQLADYSRHFDFGDLDRDGSHSKVEFIEKGLYMSEQARRGIFGAADNDGDGFVTRGEYVLNRIITDEGKAIMQAMDDDKDGAIQKAEFTSHASDRLRSEERATQVFAALDIDGNGETRIPEYLRVWGKWARAGRKPAADRSASLEKEIFKKGPKLSDDEVIRALGKLIQEADAVLDGIVSKPKRQFKNDLGSKQTLEAFLKAKTIDELLPLVADVEEIEPALRAHYKDGVREPIVVSEMTFDSSGLIPETNLKAYMYWVTANLRRIPVSVEETESGYKVDWVAFTQFLDMDIEKFIQEPGSRGGNFLAQLRRSHYFGNEYMPDINLLYAFRVQSPVAPFLDTYVFLRKDNPAAEKIMAKYRWSTGYRPVVELKWVEPDGGKPWIELVQIVRHTWRR